MKYQVVWDQLAENELAVQWLAAPDRNAVTRAAAWLEHHLMSDPLHLGESRDSSVHRVAFRAPLGIDFEVIEDDKRVVVRGVFAV
jgi:hypothetical protein